MTEILAAMPTWKLKAINRIAKTRGRIFFRDPRVMLVLRKEMERRS